MDPSLGKLFAGALATPVSIAACRSRREVKSLNQTLLFVGLVLNENRALSKLTHQREGGNGLLRTAASAIDCGVSNAALRFARRRAA